MTRAEAVRILRVWTIPTLRGFLVGDTHADAIESVLSALEEARLLAHGVRDGLARGALGEHVGPHGTDCRCSLHQLLAALSPEPDEDPGNCWRIVAPEPSR